MVTAATILAALILSSIMVFYLAAVITGWLGVFPAVVLLAAYLFDYYRGTQYTAAVIGLAKKFIPEQTPERICQVCGPDSQPLPEGHYFCYFCGRNIG